ncbi:hypothetical protein [Streptomyces sp. MMG1121]|uniref:hypothetical protein n=1 Tax=Streptomyces sp. MMG1121 TaxID=1415544 RepID=UPI0006AF3808|nr:hypothetical protein [Streptomyces sp. MMG1121]KOV64641.1 hypothetical protein ADK64_16545 [Streptomyces sp. MMG1121]
MRTPHQIWQDADLPGRRLAGLALNPSASPGVLLRLLAEGPLAVRMVLCRDRDLPGVVVDAVLGHPDRRTRGFFAVNPHVDPAQRARLVDDPEWFVRAHLADGPRFTEPDRPRPLPDATVVRILTTYEPEHLWSLYRQMSAELIRTLPVHPDPEARRHGVFGWNRMSGEQRAALLGDPDERVREAARACARHDDPAWVESTLPNRHCHGRTHALLHWALSRAVVDRVLTAPAGPDDKAMIARNRTLPPDVVAVLAADPDPEVRKETAGRTDLRPGERHALVADPDPAVRGAVARHPDLGPAERRTLAVDPDPDVRLAVSVHPGFTEEERARIDYTVPAGGRFGAQGESGTPRDPEAVRRDALSGHPLLRREAAKERTLPPDLVARLAEDADRGVRLLLAQNHPDAPADLLLRGFLEYTGPERGRLTTRPNFPRAGLAGYAGHADPQVRALAARDPDTPPATADRLTRDPDPQVRSAFARHPNLPPARLTELLAGAHDRDLAHAAAANPALDPATIERLLRTQGRGPW